MNFPSPIAVSSQVISTFLNFLINNLEAIFLGKTRSNHSLFKFSKGLALLVLNFLQTLDKLFFLLLELLSLTLILVDHSLFRLSFGLCFQSRSLLAVRMVASNALLAFLSHFTNCLSLLLSRHNVLLL